MAGRVAGKAALITGAARGQGRAHAVALAREGADIIAVDIAAPLPGVPYPPSTPEDLEETARLVKEAGRQVVPVTGDIRDADALRAEVDRGVAELGRLDVVVANAGICNPMRWDQISVQAFRDMIETNVFGTWNTVMAGAPHIVAGGRGGSIILISSLAGLKTVPFMVHYTTSKHAVTGMARAFAAELGQHGIRVNSVHPGNVNTPMGSEFVRAPLDAAAQANPVLRGMSTAFLPQRSAEPEEIADAIVYLASDESRYITGAALPIDGGIAQF